MRRFVLRDPFNLIRLVKRKETLSICDYPSPLPQPFPQRVYTENLYPGYTQTFAGKLKYCEGRKELAHTIVRLQLILFSKRTGAFLFRTFGGFLRVPTTQIYCLTGAILSETHITNKYLNNTTRSSTIQE
jgi:hypothetical protein